MAAISTWAPNLRPLAAGGNDGDPDFRAVSRIVETPHANGQTVFCVHYVGFGAVLVAQAAVKPALEFASLYNPMQSYGPETRRASSPARPRAL